MIDSNRIVQGFWTGPLTTMERLSIAPFLQNRHRFDLFTCNSREVQSVPPGDVHIMDANEIMPESEAKTFRCPEQLSDAFRIALLLKRGGWHTDLDNVCLRPLSFDTSYVFYRDHAESTISLALSKTPAGAPFLEHCHQFIAQITPAERARLAWQEIGSDFVCGAIEYFGLDQFAQRGKTFDPVQWQHVRALVDPAAKFDLSESYSVHLFHAAWNSGPVDNTGQGFDLGQQPGEKIWTDATYHPDCLYEQLKRRFNVSNNHA